MRKPTPSGGARPRVTIPPDRATKNPLNVPGLSPAAPTGPHISPEIRAELGKLNPEIAEHVRKVADTK